MKLGKSNAGKVSVWMGLFAALAAALLFMGCPDPGGETNSGPQGEACTDPKLPADGAYLAGSKIKMESKPSAADIFYTLDGTDPTAASTMYRQSDMPELVFTGGAESVTVKAIAIAEGYQNSKIVERVYTEYVLAASDPVKALFTGAAGTGARENPLKVVIPASMTKEDLALEYPDPDQMGALTVKDGLGQLFIAADAAANGKFFELDFTSANWQVAGDDGLVKGIPGCNSAVGIDRRPARNKLLAVKFPSDIVYIDQRAFQDSAALVKVDLNGLRELKAIGEYAFYGITSAEEIDFTGCTGLVKIGGRAFTYPHSVQYIDFTPCTSLQTIGDYAFAEPRRAKWIEFPASLTNLGAYQFRDCYSLEYVRFHGEVNPYWDWCQFNYHDWEHTWNGSGQIAFEYNGMRPSHLHEGVDGENSYRTDHMFVIYHPNTLTYSRWRGGYYSADDDGYFFMSQSVPETAPGPKGQLNPNEAFRGLAQITVNAAGLSADGPVTNNIDSQTVAISGGAVNFTIGTPPAGSLRPLDENTGGAIIPYFPVPEDPAEREGFRFTTPDGDEYTMPPEYGITTGATLGKPWVSPKDVQFAVLELELELTAGNQKLVRYGVESYTDKNEKYVFGREVIPVYVDKDAVITCVQRTNKMTTVSLSLKAGWNLVEKIYMAGNVTELPASTNISYRISGLVYGTANADADTPQASDSTDTRPLPWVLKN